MGLQFTKTYRRALLQACVASDACLDAIGVSSPAVLLLLGHMRSGSTLLLHLLLTNPQIAAVGERNAVYASRADFARLAMEARLARRSLFGRIRFVVDQVNHSHLTPVPALLTDARVRVLFLLRRPEASLSSLLDLSRSYYNSTWSVAKAVDYYVTRLEGLVRLADGIATPDRAAFICYENLLEAPETTLDALRGWLRLGGPLATRYQMQPFTRSRGDPGTTIGAGTIVRKAPFKDDRLGEADLLPARRAYELCRQALARFALDPTSPRSGH